MYFGSDQNLNENDISFGELNSNLIQNRNVTRPEVQPRASTSSRERPNSKHSSLRQKLCQPNDELSNDIIEMANNCMKSLHKFDNLSARMIEDAVSDEQRKSLKNMIDEFGNY